MPPAPLAPLAQTGNTAEQHIAVTNESLPPSAATTSAGLDEPDDEWADYSPEIVLEPTTAPSSPGPLPSFSEAHRLAGTFDGHTPFECPSDGQPFRAGIVEWSNTTTFHCEAPNGSLPPDVVILAQHMVFNDGATLRSAPGQNVWIYADKIEWLGKVSFEFSGPRGGDGSHGADGHAWSKVKKNGQAMEDYIKAKLHDGGDGGNGGDGWPGSNLYVQAAHEEFASTADIHIMNTGGARGQHGSGGQPDSKTLYGSDADQRNGAHPLEPPLSAKWGKDGSDGLPGAHGVFVLVGPKAGVEAIHAELAYADLATWADSTVEVGRLLASSEADRIEQVRQMVKRPRGTLSPPSSAPQIVTGPDFHWADHAHPDELKVQQYVAWVAATCLARPITLGSRPPRHGKKTSTSYHTPGNGGAADIAVVGSTEQHVYDAAALAKCLPPGFAVLLEEPVPSEGAQLNVLFVDGNIRVEGKRWTQDLADGPHIHVNAISLPKDGHVGPPSVDDKVMALIHDNATRFEGPAFTRPVPRPANGGSPQPSEPQRHLMYYDYKIPVMPSHGPPISPGAVSGSIPVVVQAGPWYTLSVRGVR
jgi:hypothetical protein